MSESNYFLLICEWQAAARKHTAAANEEDCEAGSEEWVIHAESARIYRICADQLSGLAREARKP